MKIVNLIENTEGNSGCAYAHGLSFYIETGIHKLIVDLGPSGETLENASKLGIDICDVDTVVLSHGHYDHSGGIIPFVKINEKANIYMQKTVVKDYYADDGEEALEARYRYIGIDKKILDLHQVIFIDGDYKIDDELEIFTLRERKYDIPFTNQRLLVGKKNGFSRDVFDHEQYLSIKSEGRKILVSGCAHVGIPNIMEGYYEKFNDIPDMVISGFHLMKKTAYTEAQNMIIKDMARKMMEYPAKYITCHCTGLEAFEMMKEIMGDKLGYVHSGEEIEMLPV